MKILAPLAAAAVLASTLVASAQDIVIMRAMPGLDRAIVADNSGMTPRNHSAAAALFDRSILHPIPLPFPWPGPNPCLSCPTFDMDMGDLVLPMMR